MLDRFFFFFCGKFVELNESIQFPDLYPSFPIFVFFTPLALYSLRVLLFPSLYLNEIFFRLKPVNLPVLPSRVVNTCSLVLVVVSCLLTTILYTLVGIHTYSCLVSDLSTLNSTQSFLTFLPHPPRIKLLSLFRDSV